MKRGPLMPRGIELAVPVALRRGQVGVFIRSLVTTAEILITGNGRFVLVGVRYARKFCACIAEIEAEFAEVITMLRLVPRTGPVSCELWLYSRYDTLRHFRIDDAGLVELDAYGIPLDEARPAEAAVLPDRAASIPPDASAAPAASSAPESRAPASPDKRGPVLRWLAKWNAARLAGKSVDGIESSRLRNILDAVRPSLKRKRCRKKNPVEKIPAGAPEPEEIDPAGIATNKKDPVAVTPCPESLMTSAEGKTMADGTPKKELPPGNPAGG